MATASTSRRGSKPWPIPAGCSSPIRFMTTCATGCPLSSRIWASSRSRTSPGRCGSTGSAHGPHPTPPLRRGRLPLAGRVQARCGAAGGVATQPLPLPDKPSIAVLPFANMSGDPEQEYFADGMVEEIITALSRIRWLFVIARNSSFTYKGQAVDVKQVGRELGVRYVLEGSVRKAGGRVRITAQLIDATNGTHLWADRFDGSLEMCSIFKISRPQRCWRHRAGIAGGRNAPLGRSPTTPISTPTISTFVRWQLSPSDNGERVIEALGLLDRAITIDPHFAPALGLGRYGHLRLDIEGWADEPQTNRRRPPSGSARAPGGRTTRTSSPLPRLCWHILAKTSVPIGLVDRAPRAQSQLRPWLVLQRASEALCRAARSRDRAHRNLTVTA